MKTKITLLGSGCWEGTPAPFCDCRICQIASADPLSVESRSRPSIHVHTNMADVLFEMSPDIRLQSTRFSLPPIEHFVISHWHFDHMFGLYELHAWIELVLQKPITIYCSEAAAEFLERQFGYIPKNIVVVRAYEPFLIGDITITPLPVYHMNRIDDGKAPEALNNTFGYLVETADTKIAYLADYYEVPQKTLDLLRGSATAVIDGTYLFQEEYPDKPYQNATHDEQDPDHLHGAEIIKFGSSIGVDRVVYHSIAHLPELTHQEMQAKLPKGQFIGHDGYEL